MAGRTFSCRPTRWCNSALRGVRHTLSLKPMKTTKKARKLSVTLVVRTGVRAGKRAIARV